MTMRRALLSMASALCLLAVACGGVGGDGERPERGRVVSVAPVFEMTGAETGDYLAEWKYPVAGANGVRAHRVVYETIAADGTSTTASGLVVVPDTGVPRLRLVSYAHGTTVRRDEAPSADGETERARTVQFAAAGYAAVAPDYLGLGEGPGFHPYAHAPTEASASADLLLAARSLLADQGRDLDQNVLVTGFSQGAQAALALGRELNSGAVEGFAPAAVAAVSGAYAVQEVQAPAALDGRVEGRRAVLYLGYWITAMNRIYHLYDDPAEAFQQPYAQRIDGLFDGHHDLLAVSSGLPDTPQKLLTPRFLELARNPTGAALQAMADSESVCDWTATVPVRLFAAPGDRSVPFENSLRCTKAELGASAELIDLGDIDHGATVREALPRILDWFRETQPPA
ncbi:alpha/beta hydrolase [Nocardia sienata]|uniref:alpha/beta hydrolase n=1 Tax=Nocardia sienata TaxID=248552 RepID=UPI0012EE391A|nr:alpha/beta hydrolase [Nocardia sienata]